MRRVRITIVAAEQQYYIFCVCVCVFCQIFSPRYVTQCAIFGKELLNIKYMFLFSLQMRLKIYNSNEKLNEILS